MTERKDDGGPAFPTGGFTGPCAGMSLRDWFAGQALVGLGESAPLNEDGTFPSWDDLDAIRAKRAAWSYKQADAMLAERAKK